MATPFGQCGRRQGAVFRLFPRRLMTGKCLCGLPITAHVSTTRFRMPGCQYFWIAAIGSGGYAAKQTCLRLSKPGGITLADTGLSVRLPNVFFFHNPKAGGTSISQWLGSLYDTEERAPIIVNDGDRHRALAGQYDHYRGYRFYAGHYGRDIFESVGSGHKPITNFRDPVRRLISLYNYFRIVVPATDEVLTQPRFACVQAAKRQGVSEFLLNTDPAVELYTRDYHVRQLTLSGFEPVADLGIAMEMVDAMPWFFVAEMAEQSRAWAERWLQLKVPRFPRSNETPAHVEQVTNLEPAVEQLVRERNQLDYALYEFALSRIGT